MFENFPYTNFHDLNLDWIIQKVKEAYSPDNPPENVVLSVNGETGDVVLYKDAVVRLPDVDESTWNIHRVADNNSTGIEFKNNSPAKRIDGVHRYAIYDEGNPPTYPVTSVNGNTGNVIINIPVQSVNGLTGNIILYQNAQIAFPTVTEEQWNMYRGTGENGVITGIQFKTGDPAQRIDGNSRYNIYDEGNPPPYPVTSVNTLTGSVAILDTSIVTDQGTQKIKIAFPVTSVDGQTGNVNTWGYTANRVLSAPVNAEGDSWGIQRGILSGTIGLDLDYDSVDDEFSGYITFKASGSSTVQRIKILTPNDIPSGSGVISINGYSGVVVLTAMDIAMSGLDSTKINTLINNNTANNGKLFNNMATTWTELNNYLSGSYVLYNGILYKATANNSAGAWATQSWTQANITDGLSYLEQNLKSFTVTSARKSSAFTLQLEQNYTYIIFMVSGFADDFGLWLAYGTSTSPQYFEIAKGNDITITTNTDGTITFTPAHTRTVRFTILRCAYQA